MQSKAEALNEWKKKFYASPSQKIFDTCYNFISFGADYNEEMDEERMSQIETIVDTGLEEMNEAACYRNCFKYFESYVSACVPWKLQEGDLFTPFPNRTGYERHRYA